MAKRVAYNAEEDDVIWQWVNVECPDESVTGSRLWAQLVASGRLPGRSADSLKGRYRKSLVPLMRRTLGISSPSPSPLLGLISD